MFYFQFQVDAATLMNNYNAEKKKVRVVKL